MVSFGKSIQLQQPPHKFTLFARSAKLSMHMGMQPGIMKDTGSRIVMVCTVMGIISLRMRLNIK